MPYPNIVYRKQHPVLYNLSLPFPHYTPFQNLIRHLLFQRGEYTESQISRPFHITLPGLPPDTAECTVWMDAKLGSLSVSFRRQGDGAGIYIENPKTLPVNGVRAHFGGADFTPPIGFQQYDGTHPTVVCCIPCTRVSHLGDTITHQAETLAAAGYHVVYYRIKRRDQFCLEDAVRNELYALRGVVAVMTLPLPLRGDRILIYPSPDAVQATQSFGRCLTLAEWVAEQAAAAAAHP